MGKRISENKKKYIVIPIILLCITIAIFNVSGCRRDTAKENNMTYANFFDFIKLLPGNVDGKGEGTFYYTAELTEGTKWTASNLNAEDVHKATLKHEQKDSLKNWEIRIGKGGQIYSMTTAAGELIPPQEHPGAEWMDEVFQIVAVNTQLNDTDNTSTSFFIHQAGIYWEKQRVKLDPEYLKKSWYSPMLADYYDPGDKSFSTIVWGQQAHTPSIHKSNLLYYTKIKDVGDGVIEVSYIIENFGDVSVNHLNLPWGGVRESNLPVQLLSNADGSYTVCTNSFGGNDAGKQDINATDGWFAWAKENKNDSMAFGLVFGKDRFNQKGYEFQSRKAVYRYGRTNKTRDYNVGTVILPVEIKPGDIFYYRTYFIVGTVNDVSKKAEEFSSKVDYGFLKYSEDDCDKIPLWIENIDGQDVIATDGKADGKGEPILFTYAHPVNGAVPLFEMKDTATGKKFVSFDPYQICTKKEYANPYKPGDPKYELYENRVLYKPYDGKTEYLRFLGYALLTDNTAHEQEYKHLADILTDRSYYPMSAAEHGNIIVLKNISD